MRILHFSDPHLHLPLSQMPLGNWFGKRVVGALNLLRGRSKRFSRVEKKLAALATFHKKQDIELVICTGDYTALGLETELAKVRRAVEPLMHGEADYITVPGNHDLYAPDVVRENWFIRYFQDALISDLPEYSVDGPWPQVRLIGDDLAVVAVNSAKPNLLWRSDGRIPVAQLSSLNDLLDDKRLADRFIMVITHYAARMPDGKPDTKLHGLCNGEDFLSVCSKIKRGALLCGHIHHRYQVAIKGLQANLFCAGSATMEGRESFWVYELTNGQFHAYPGYWDGEAYQLEE
jgi:3',5'-cyclic AMP phosphodiesterase CpdA